MTNKIMDTITGITRMASYRKTKIIISLCFVSVQSKSVKYRLMNIIIIKIIRTSKTAPSSGPGGGENSQHTSYLNYVRPVIQRMAHIDLLDDVRDRRPGGR